MAQVMQTFTVVAQNVRLVDVTGRTTVVGGPGALSVEDNYATYAQRTWPNDTTDTANFIMVDIPPLPIPAGATGVDINPFHSVKFRGWRDDHHGYHQYISVTPPGLPGSFSWTLGQQSNSQLPTSASSPVQTRTVNSSSPTWQAGMNDVVLRVSFNGQDPTDAFHDGNYMGMQQILCKVVLSYLAFDVTVTYNEPPPPPQPPPLVRLDRNTLRSDLAAWSDYGYLGAFAVAPARTVSLQVQAACPAGVWMWPEAVFLERITDSEMAVVSVEKMGTPVRLGAAWSEINRYREASEAATHWVANLRLYDKDPRVEPNALALPGTEVYFDCAYVPDNGFDLVEWEQPYLDGDRDYGIWEGERRNSTSVFGTKEPEGTVLGTGLIVPGTALVTPPPPPPQVYPVTIQTQGPYAQVVGTGSQWSDGNDATYAIVGANGTGKDRAERPIAPIPGVTSGSSVRLRLRVEAINANAAGVQMIFDLYTKPWDDPETLYMGSFDDGSGYVWVPESGIQDLVVPLGYYESATLYTGLADGAYLAAYGSLGGLVDYQVTIYEATVEIV